MQCIGLVSICCLYVLCEYSAAAKLPDFIQLCPRDSPDISLCFKNAMEELRFQLPKGIPELKIPSLTPLVLPEIILNQISPSINAIVILENFTMNGLEHYEILNVTIDLDKPLLSWKLRFPHLDMLTDFNANGELLQVTIDGNGIAEGKFSDVLITAEFSGRKIVKKGEDHFAFQPTKCIFEMGTMSAVTKNLFKDNPETEDILNRLIKENSDLLLPEVNPILGKIIGDVMLQLINAVFDLYSIDQLFPQN